MIGLWRNTSGFYYLIVGFGSSVARSHSFSQWKGPPIHFYPSDSAREPAGARHRLSLINSVKTQATSHYEFGGCTSKPTDRLQRLICLCCAPNIVKWFSFINTRRITNKRLKWNSRWVRVCDQEDKWTLALSDSGVKIDYT